MQDSVYSAVFGALSNEHRMNMITNNLANVNTVGFKRDRVSFEDVIVPFAHDRILDSRAHLQAKPLWPDADVLAKPRLSSQRIDFEQGGMRQTGNPLDLAINGDGFFKIMTPDGVRYTRAGNFSLSSGGQIVDTSGNPLLGEGGELTVPPGSKVVIDSAGNVSASGQVVGRITLARFDDPQALEKEGGSRFRLAEDAAAQELPVEAGAPGENGAGMQASISQGFLEEANVGIVPEMVRMIETQRTFQAYQKVMQGEQELDRKLMTSMGRPVI